MTKPDHMTSLERMNTAVAGGRPDRVPIFFINDIGYIMRQQGKNVRDFRTGTAQEMRQYIINGFDLHDCDAYMVHQLNDHDFSLHNTLVDINKERDLHIYKNKDTGKLFMVNAAGDRYEEDGTPLHMLDSSFESRIACSADIRRLVPDTVQQDTQGEYGYFGPLCALSAKYPDNHMVFQRSTPLARALDACGGYEAGLCLLAENEPLMTELLEAFTNLELQLIKPGKTAGGRSVFMTSYFTGADTISPGTFRRVVLPFEKRIMQACRDAGLYVIYWFLGDMAPLLEDFKTMPFDAIAPEQPRKGYGVSAAELRSAFPDRCVFAYTYERQMTEGDMAGIEACFDEQYIAAGQRGAFVAGSTITPEDARPEAMEHYINTVKKYIYQ